MGVQWKDLNVWQKTHGLVLEIYRVTASFPKSELYGLVDQLKREAYSVAANIVEGQARDTTKDYIRFLFNARGSLEEVRYFLMLACDLGFLSSDKYEKLENRYSDVSKMLNGLIKSLKTSSNNP